MTFPLEQLEAKLRGMLHQGMRLGESTVKNMLQILAAKDAQELASRLTDHEDAEAWSMRDLALFPDHEFALTVEAWLLEQETRLGELPAVNHQELTDLAAMLDHAVIILRLPDQSRVQLVLDVEEAFRFVTRLNLQKTFPSLIKAFLAELREAGNTDLVPAVRLACRQARLTWTTANETFVLNLLQGCFAADENDALRRQTLDLVQWCLRFLEHAGEDIPGALARRRDELLKNLDQAEEMERIRKKYNFETRRMLGIVEQHLEETALQDELALVELVARATGGYPSQYQVMRKNLGEARTMGDMHDIMDG
ncbi:hypothetical protein SAMN05660653_01189 [Desulfonatronum thiosulfatophilum]|uniref:Uncharacterized protein n=1 Tax=Desulfonatronum thiosulfatophilum TaxID=617002 RepID=A0A1G6BXE5_9BACT|nr:hypothetical protein [Desulfonatronum thiosulfatophilum]SDB25280.1 hypothetical protein SAMN05660653_01189 [Desulfonatronum thiosulfatophilum]